jgi:hypothetical protein
MPQSSLRQFGDLLIDAITENKLLQSTAAKSETMESALEVTPLVASPNLAVTNQNDDCMLFVASGIVGLLHGCLTRTTAAYTRNFAGFDCSQLRSINSRHMEHHNAAICTPCV